MDMKRFVAILFCVLALCGFSWAKPSGGSTVSFDAVVDFESTIKDFHGAAESGNALSSTRFVLLTGTVGSISLLKDAALVYRVEFISGEWIDTTEVKAYRVFIDFSGEQFTPWFDRKTGTIKPGTRLIIVAQAVGVAEAPDGSGKAAFLSGLKLKVAD